MTELLNGVTVLVAPGGFPARTPYVLVEDPGYVRLTRPLLAAVGADRFLRYVPPTVGPGDVDPAAAVVVASDDWPGVLAQLRRRFPPSRLVVLLNPGHYPWGYLEVARAAPDRLAELLDPSVSVGLKARWLRDYLIRYAFTGFDGLDPVWYPECYFTPYRDLTRRHGALVHDVTAGLADRESRESYGLVLYGSPEELLEQFLARVFRVAQYAELGRLRPGDVVVNAGVADGWDIPFLLAGTRGIGRHLLLDPTTPPPGSPADRLPEVFGLEPMRVGLWDREETLVFPVDEAGMVVGNRPGEADPGRPTASVRCGRLDDVVAAAGVEQVDLIKMDIEGAEPRALDGMTETIDRFRPTLAVCIYHRPEHMWEIPAALMGRLSNYRFEVRHYSPVRFECVLYATPVERLPAAARGDPLAAAGLDPRAVRRALEVAGLADEYPPLLGSPSPDRLAAVGARVGAALAAVPAGERMTEIDLSPADPDLLGWGWGWDGADRTATWRWVGPDGRVSWFLALDRSVPHRVRIFLHHAENQAAFDVAELNVDGKDVPGRVFGQLDGRYFIEWDVPPGRPVSGHSRLQFRTAAGLRQVAVARLVLSRAAG